MLHPWDKAYELHNENLRRAKAEGRQKYHTTPDEQDLRASEWEDAFRASFPWIGKSKFLEKFKEVSGYDPMTKAGEERFVEEHGFIPELVF